MFRSRINSGIIVLLLHGFLFINCKPANKHPYHSIGIDEYPNAKDLYGFTEEQRKKYDLPALGVGIIHKGKIIGLGMAGERKIGSNDWAAVDDLFDFASCMKSMTATVVAMLVEKGRISWNTTLTEIFPELVPVMRTEYHDVTMEMLLAHRSGLNSWMGSYNTWTDWYKKYGSRSCRDQRYLFTRKVLQDQPLYQPGTKYHYCNDGYLVVASIVEKITGEPWEEYIYDQLFLPLKFTSTYAGLPDTINHKTIVWGHEKSFLSIVKAISPEYESEHGNPNFGAGSGKLFASVPDLLRYINFHIQGSNGQAPLLSRKSFTKLHTPLDGQQYALGWNVELKRNNGKVIERSIFHGGYTGRFRSNIWFCPESQYGTVIVYNYATGKAIDAYENIFYSLLREFQILK
jgi:CubicO group peptidase (beta-lactamase class C family)